MSAAIRTFIAVDIGEAARASLAKLMDEFRRQGLEGVRWVDPQGIHLTLKFLGDIDPALTPQILDAVGRAATESGPFALSMGALGVFPNRAKPRVVWMGLEGGLAALATLQRSVEGHVSPLGFPRDRRGFNPHLTLGRTRRELPPRQLEVIAGAVEGGLRAAAEPWLVDRVNFIHSTLTPQGAVYRPLGHAQLQKERQVNH